MKLKIILISLMFCSVFQGCTSEKEKIAEKMFYAASDKVKSATQLSDNDSNGKYILYSESLNQINELLRDHHSTIIATKVKENKAQVFNISYSQLENKVVTLKSSVSMLDCIIFVVDKISNTKDSRRDINFGELAYYLYFSNRLDDYNRAIKEIKSEEVKNELYFKIILENVSKNNITAAKEMFGKLVLNTPVINSSMSNISKSGKIFTGKDVPQYILAVAQKCIDTQNHQLYKDLLDRYVLEVFSIEDTNKRYILLCELIDFFNNNNESGQASRILKKLSNEIIPSNERLVFKKEIVQIDVLERVVDLLIRAELNEEATGVSAVTLKKINELDQSTHNFLKMSNLLFKIKANSNAIETVDKARKKVSVLSEPYWIKEMLDVLLKNNLMQDASQLIQDIIDNKMNGVNQNTKIELLCFAAKSLTSNAMNQEALKVLNYAEKYLDHNETIIKNQIKSQLRNPRFLIAQGFLDNGNIDQALNNASKLENDSWYEKPKIFIEAAGKYAELGQRQNYMKVVESLSSQKRNQREALLKVSESFVNSGKYDLAYDTITNNDVATSSNLSISQPILINIADYFKKTKNYDKMINVINLHSKLIYNFSSEKDSSAITLSRYLLNLYDHLANKEIKITEISPELLPNIVNNWKPPVDREENNNSNSIKNISDSKLNGLCSEGCGKIYNIGSESYNRCNYCCTHICQ